MKIGVLINLTKNVEADFAKANELGIKTCQLCCWDLKLMTDETADMITKLSEKFDVDITAFWCGWSGPVIWDFKSGPNTLGLAPKEYRFIRMKELMGGLDFAKKINVKDVVTHAGFIPENPSSTEYFGMAEVIKHIAEYAKKNEQNFLFETGQETPVTLMRLIEDVGTGNLGVNLDPANLLMYGNANPVDAVDIFGKYIKGVHGKDGMYPTDGYHLGEEKRIGDGRVNYPLFIERLKAVGYEGAITIEREISGEKQIEDIIYAKEYLEKLI